MEIRTGRHDRIVVSIDGGVSRAVEEDARIPSDVLDPQRPLEIAGLHRLPGTRQLERILQKRRGPLHLGGVHIAQQGIDMRGSGLGRAGVERLAQVDAIPCRRHGAAQEADQPRQESGWIADGRLEILHENGRPVEAGQPPLEDADVIVARPDEVRRQVLDDVFGRRRPADEIAKGVLPATDRMLHLRPGTLDRIAHHHDDLEVGLQRADERNDLFRQQGIGRRCFALDGVLVRPEIVGVLRQCQVLPIVIEIVKLLLFRNEQTIDLPQDAREPGGAGARRADDQEIREIRLVAVGKRAEPAAAATAIGDRYRPTMDTWRAPMSRRRRSSSCILRFRRVPIRS